MLTAGELFELTDEVVLDMTAGVSHKGGITPMELKVWHANGIIADGGGVGRGNYREYDLTQTIAIAYAVQWARTAGASHAMLKGLVEAVTGLGAEFLRKLAAGKCSGYLLPQFGPGGRVIDWAKVKPAEGEDDVAALDLPGMIRRVSDAIQAMAARIQPKPLGGRKRGLEQQPHPHLTERAKRRRGKRG